VGVVRHAGMHACDAWPSGRQVGLLLRFLVKPLRQGIPICSWKRRPDGRPGALPWLPAAAAAARCMHAGLLGGLGSVRPPLSLSRRYLLASGLWRKKKGYCYAIVPPVRGHYTY
jgi:hypothetical protein